MNRGLADRRVVNTRATHQAPALDDLLRAHGAVPVDYPCIEIVPAGDDAQLDAALRQLAGGGYAWLVLTSANSVLAVARRVNAMQRSLAGAQFRAAAIGPATRDAAREELGVECSIVPEKFVAESLGESLPVAPGETVLIPESALARPVLAEILRARGAVVDVVTAYRTACGRGGADVPDLLARGEIDAVAFTSSSTVGCFLERIARDGGSVERALELCAVCIGPVTADAARERGFTEIVVADEFTLPGLTATLERYFCNELSTGEDRS